MDGFLWLHVDVVSLLKNQFTAKVGCPFPMVISSDFRMEKHKDDDLAEDTPYDSYDS